MLQEKYLYHDSADVQQGRSGNVIPEPEREPLWNAYLAKFKDPIIIILLVVLLFSVAVSVYEIYSQGKGISTLIEPLGILIAILLATGIGFLFEYNAEKEFRILNKVKDDRKVKVLRWTTGANGNRSKSPQLLVIKKMDVCVGDIVVLEGGDEVPADGEVVESNGLMVDESAFTGEPFTTKSETPREDSEETYPSNFLLRGSIITDGTAKMRVTAVGVATEEGKGSKLEEEGSTVETPLNKQLNQLAGWIAKASYFIAVLIIIGRLLVFFSTDDAHTTLEIIEVVISSVMIAVTLIVVAVPEGLPMSITISLALSMRKMLKQNNLVRKLHACETLGATTVICTDKTGTLTQNKMKVVEHNFYTQNLSLVAEGVILNSSAQLTDVDGSVQTVGNPTECAILTWLYSEDKGYFESVPAEFESVCRVPFSSERKYMETTVRRISDGSVSTYIKGAPEVLLERCQRVAGGVSKEAVKEKLLEYQNKGMRTLAFSIKGGDDGIEEFMGVVAIADPVRDDVKSAIETCKNRAGIRVIMITGDVMPTACEIARQLDIIDGNVSQGGRATTISGPDFRGLDDATLKKDVLPYLCVMSRAKPEDKARLVTLLQEMGEVVAVTGDGTNDAPALKLAQVGLSMGDGTARAKEASDVTIINNSFSSINSGIMWGRSIYLNIKRFIFFQMTINLCACIVVLAGACMGLDSPLTVTQMLWVNLIMDTLAAIALSSIPADENVMNEKPRNPKSHIIDRHMGVRIFITGTLFFVISLLQWQILWHTDVSSVRELIGMMSFDMFSNLHIFGPHAKPHLSPYESGLFFTTFVVLQFWNLFNARFFKTNGSILGDVVNLLFHRDEFKRTMCTSCLAIAIVILVVQYLITTFVGFFFNSAPLSLQDWGLLLLVTSPVLVIPDVVRFINTLT